MLAYKRMTKFFSPNLFRFILIIIFLPFIVSFQAALPEVPSWKIAGIRAALKDPNPGTREIALDKLGDCKITTALIPDLVVMLKDPDSGVRAAAVKVLSRMPESAASQAPKIAELLKDPDSDVRAAAAEALSEMGESAVSQAPKIAELLKDPDSDVRAAAAEALSEMGESAASQAPKIAELLKDPESGVRAAAAEALGKMRKSAAPQAPKIAELLKDLDRGVQLAAGQALGLMGESAASQAPKIVELLKDPRWDVRFAAAEALGQMRKSVASQAPKIAELLKDPDGTVRYIAAIALGKMQESAASQAPKVAELLKDPIWRVKIAAVAALGQMGKSGASQAPKIAELLKDPESDVRVAAARALGQMGESAASQVPKIIELLKDPDWAVQTTAAQALVQIEESAAFPDPEIAELLKEPDSGVRSAAAEWLGEMGESAASQAPKIAELLNDPNRRVRYDAAEALGQMGESAASQAPKVAELLKDPESDVRAAAARALGQMGKLDITTTVLILSAIHNYPQEIELLRFLAHYLSGGDSLNHTLVYWLGRPDLRPSKLSRQKGKLVLKTFRNSWKLCDSLVYLRKEIEEQTAVVVDMVSWEIEDLKLLEKHLNLLYSAKSTHAATVANVITSLKRKHRFFNISQIWFFHAAFWLLLIFAYPKSPQIQAIFFWNPWVRRIIGLGYIGFALAWVPYLRRKLFAPFRESLLADAALNNFNSAAYFKDSEVKDEITRDVRLINEMIPEIKGQIVLQGDSGLGKTMFLRHMIIRSKRIAVFLPAEKCADGVEEAIQAKFHGLAKKSVFLRNLIDSGAVDIYIDGLNEVSADTRAEISGFVERYSQGNIIITTQPLEWRPPSTAKINTLLPLKEEKIEKFLLSLRSSLPEEANITYEQYERIALQHLSKVLDVNQPLAILDSFQRILSNPMDLTLFGQMIALGQEPDLFNLHKQQYHLMASDYKRLNLNQEFPLRDFSEVIYQLRLKDSVAIPDQKFEKELLCMERHNMVIKSQSKFKNAKGRFKNKVEWNFRHDIIKEFFIVQTFLGENNDRANEHIGDPRFNGVYFLLATLLPLDDANNLERILIDYAADKKDHTVSDKFIHLLRARKDARPENNNKQSG